VACASLRFSASGLPSQKSPRPERQTVSAFYYLYLSERIFEVTKLYVGNLPFTATEDAVRTLFATHGSVDKVSLINDRDSGRPRGFGFVEMSNADASRAMQALNGTDFEGRTLKVNEAQQRERSGGGGGGPRRY
jgi:RNA recognition motif-containing protein